MNDDNMKLVRAEVNMIGDELKATLQPHPDHPVRNPYAHIWCTIKEKYGISYRELGDNRVEEILTLIRTLRNQNPQGSV
jgi:hypothetical protein